MRGDRSSPKALAYLVSQYPTLNHTFILREIRTLRALGWQVQTISIRPPDRNTEGLTQEEREEVSTTLYIQQCGFLRILGIHAAALCRRPIAYVGGLLMALRLAGPDPRRIPRHLFYFAEAVIAGAWMTGRGFQHFHTHFSANVALLSARVFPVTFSMTIHGPDEFNDIGSSHLGEKIRLSRFSCAISDFARSQMMRASDSNDWHKIDKCYLGVDPDLFKPGLFRVSPQPFRIICVGRLAPVKAHHVLLDAAAELIRRRRNIELCIVGDGPERLRLEQHAAASGLSGNVRFTGGLSQPDVQALYRQSDCFALASFAEGVPVVLMEAMSMEIPCVATWIMGIPELIRHDQDGLLVPPADALAIACEVERLMDDPELRERLGKSARRRIQEKFTLEKNALALAGVFERRLNDSRQ